MEAAINEFQPFNAPGPDGLYPVLLQKGCNQLKRYYHVIFQAQLCAIGLKRRHRYITSQNRREKLFLSKILPYDHFNLAF